MSAAGRRLPTRDDLLDASGGARRGGAAQRARPDPAGGDAERRPGGDRLHHPGHGRAVRRRRPRRLHVVPLAVLDLPARAGDLGAALRQARRSLRPQAVDAVRRRAVRARLAAVRRRLGDDLADRLPAGAGPRRRCDRADRDDDHRRHLHVAGAGDRAGLHGQRLGDRGPGRPDPRRRLLRHHRLAVDLLRQPAARRGRRVGAVATLRGERRAPPAPDRLPRLGPARRRRHPAAPGPPRGRGRVGVGLAGQPRAVRGRGRAAGRGSCWSSGARPSRSCRCGSSGCGSSTSPTPARWSSASC